MLVSNGSGRGNGGVGKVGQELSGGVDMSSWESALANQTSKISHLLGSKFSDHNCDTVAQ